MTEVLDTVAALLRAVKHEPTLGVRILGRTAGLLSKDSVYGFTYHADAASRPFLEVAIGLPYRIRTYQSGDLFSIFAIQDMPAIPCVRSVALLRRRSR